MDVNLDGHMDQSAWAAPQDGVLVWNKFGNGLVTDKSQYAFTAFGGLTDLQGLRVGFDTNADGAFAYKTLPTHSAVGGSAPRRANRNRGQEIGVRTHFQENRGFPECFFLLSYLTTP